MERTLSHDEVAELLGAYALDAVESDEAAAIAAHLETCPRCSAELAEHREVVGMIANAGGDAPVELWDRIAQQIQPPGAPPDLRPAGVAPPTPLAGARRRRRTGRAVAAVAAGAAAAVIALLGVQVGRLDNRVGQLAAAAQHTGLSQAVQAAFLATDKRTVTLADRSGTPAADLLILPDGSAFVVNVHLRALPADRTYQLWAFAGGRPVSLGLLGNHPVDVPFTVNPTVAATTFAVTTEPAGGVVAPTSAPVAASPGAV